MGFFYENSPPKKEEVVSTRLASLGCKACPLNHAKLHSPKMKPTGPDAPEIYILGEAPGESEDLEGKQFIGKSGKFLRSMIPSALAKNIRWNNTIRCRPPDNRTPTALEVQCCAQYQIADIAETKPRAIFAFGGTPLKWLLRQQAKNEYSERAQITGWRGRRFPVEIGGHRCWVYPFLHPSYVLRKQNEEKYGEPVVRTNARDLKLAFAHYYAYGDPPVLKKEDLEDSITCLYEPDLKGLFEALDFIRENQGDSVIGIDLETKRLSVLDSDSKLLSISVGIPELTIAFPFEHREARWTAKQRAKLAEYFKEFLLTTRVKTAHNLAFEIEWLIKYFGEEVAYRAQWGDTMARAYVVDERNDVLALDDITRIYLGCSVKSWSDVGDKKNLDNLPLEKLLPYNALDAAVMPWLEDAMLRYMQGTEEVYQLQVRRIPMLALMKLKGVAVDFDEVDRQIKKTTKEATKLKKELEEMPEVKLAQKRKGKKFKLPAGVAVKEVLHINNIFVDDTEEEALKALGTPFATKVLELRAAEKLLSTYLLPYSKEGGKWIAPDGRVHSTFDSLFTRTGRLSSADPNLQNFPSRKGTGQRRIIYAPPGHDMLKADYGQIEARVIAMASKDKTLCDSLWEGYDIHGEWARKIASAYPKVIGGRKFLTDKDVMKKFRDKVKNKWTFPLFFGSVLYSVSRDLEVPEHIVEPLFDEFWASFSSVKAYQETVVNDLIRYGYVSTLTGRRRHDPMEPNKAINMGIQGTASDIAVEAMVAVSREAVETQIEWMKPILNVHDEADFYVPQEFTESAIMEIGRELCRPRFDFINVPLVVEISVGPNWEDLEEVMSFSSVDFGHVRKEKA